MKSKKGFTLIELMIVVAIIGILAAIAIPRFADLIKKSKEGATKGNLGAVRSALSIYYGDMEGRYPAIADAAAAVTLQTIMAMDNGKYLREMPSCKTPNYHTDATTAVTLDFDSAADNGVWGYDGGNGADLAIAARSDDWGHLWVDCSHTDSKSTRWTVY